MSRLPLGVRGTPVRRAGAGVVGRQLTEVPQARAEVTEHQMAGRRCGCGTVTWADALDKVPGSAWEAAIAAKGQVRERRAGDACRNPRCAHRPAGSKRRTSPS